MTYFFVKTLKIFVFIVFFSIFSASANNDLPQSFPKGDEVNIFMPNDMFMFAKLGDFIKPDSNLTLLNIEHGSIGSRHAKQTEAVFFTVAPADLHESYRQISRPRVSSRISASKISEPAIVLTPTWGKKYVFSGIIKKHPDTVILVIAGNKGKSKPENANPSYRKATGINIFHVGGTIGSHIISSLHKRSSKPGNYGYAYISAPYRTITSEGKSLYGTSFAIQIVAAKLAMLYEALNVNHKWSMRDAMQLLMTTREEQGYQANLTKLLVKDKDGKILRGENGETFLLSENELRARLQTSPFYSKNKH